MNETRMSTTEAKGDENADEKFNLAP
jgi:hypothetical protein